MAHMIRLHMLVPPYNHQLFRIHPELNSIWEVPALQEDARQSYEEWNSQTGDTGECFSINDGVNPIGIIGWFEYGEFPHVLRLRYYGIIPEKRGRGYGEEALRLLLKHL